MTGLSGTPQFLVAIDVAVLPGVTTPGTLRVRTGGIYSQDQRARVTVTLPAGLELLSGSTQREVPIGPSRGISDEMWDLIVQPAHPGRFEVGATMEVDVGGEYGTDECEWRLVLEVSPESTTVRSSRSIRFERVSRGQRYRYTGAYMVPIGESRRITHDEIVDHPIILHRVIAECRACGLEQPLEVPFVVFVDHMGGITDFRRLPSVTHPDRAPDSVIYSAAVRALRAWRFSPGRTRDADVEDYTEVQVEVRP
jgi:hypothetical protein